MADLQPVELVAVIVAIPGQTDPRVLVIGAPGGVPRLPSGPLRSDHRSLQYGLRSWVRSQSGLELGFVEQLYTFADRERTGPHGRVVSVSYLGLTSRVGLEEKPDAQWRGWYDVFPWEDRRGLTDAAWLERHHRFLHGLREWAGSGADSVRAARTERVQAAYGLTGRLWAPENCLQRYELLWEAGLVPESSPIARGAAGGRLTQLDDPSEPVGRVTDLGTRMLHDHRRILSTGMARLRAKIQYRPVIFELVPSEFTLGQLQQTVEAVAGTAVHKQNFRRIVEGQQLVE
ncbi:MAG: hypothetical protein Q4P32_11495 [Micrococcales bacterium]|nr:hypothetical protein [Micrococcales bacterium]